MTLLELLKLNQNDKTRVSAQEPTRYTQEFNPSILYIGYEFDNEDDSKVKTTSYALSHISWTDTNGEISNITLHGKNIMTNEIEYIPFADMIGFDTRIAIEKSLQLSAFENTND